MSRTRRQGIVFLSTSLLLGLFQNCGEFNSSSSGSPASIASLCKVQNKVSSPFAQGKLQLLDQVEVQNQRKLGAGNSRSLALVVDTQCLEARDQDLRFMDQVLDWRANPFSLDKQVLALEFASLPPHEDLQKALDADPCLIGLTENLPVHRGQVSSSSLNLNDPEAGNQAHLTFLGYPESRALQARITTPVVVAVVDTGVDYNHQDLRQRMWRGTQNEPGANMLTNTLTPLDDDGHGTHVAGILAAQENNQFGTAGLLSSFVRIMAVKALGQDGSGSSQDVANGIRYALRNGADIINLSVEAPGRNTLMEDALLEAVQAGAVVVTATGNQGQLITPTNLFAPAYIAPQLEGVLSVASVDVVGLGLSYFSNYSNQFAEFAAPGAEVAQNPERGILSSYPNNGMRRVMGTSQATPMVSAAAALLVGALKTQNVGYTPAGLESFLKENGSGRMNTLTNQVGGGRLIQLGFLSRNIETFLRSSQASLPNQSSALTNPCLID